MSKPLRDEERLDALFELGAVLDRLGQPAAAMAVFSQAKQRIREGPEAGQISGERFLERVARSRAWFTRERLHTAADRVISAGLSGPVFFRARGRRSWSGCCRPTPAS